MPDSERNCVVHLVTRESGDKRCNPTPKGPKHPKTTQNDPKIGILSVTEERMAKRDGKERNQKDTPMEFLLPAGLEPATSGS
jgi:hypothetical protein